MDTITENKLKQEKISGLKLRLNDDKFSKLRKKIKIKTEEMFHDKNLAEIFYQCFFNTIDTTSHFQEDNTVFVLTGDIPAMWLRDSVAQVMQYLFFAKDDQEVSNYLKGVLRRQFRYMQIDPYANAFKQTENSYGQWDGAVITDRLPKIVWERKYELDSLCYPFFLACKYYEETKDITHFDEDFLNAFDTMVETVKKEQKHSEKSSYHFVWKSGKQKVGYSDPKGEKGLVWSGFRPSDDDCKYHYHIPDNMFLVSVLYKLAKIFQENLNDQNRCDACVKLIDELKPLIEQYGVVEVDGKKVYVSETDCMGNYHIDDDANIPSLLSLPYLEYPYLDQEIYQNTRNFVLSHKNKYYCEGKYLSGIGSPHTPQNRVWPLAVAMQGITSDNEAEIKKCFEMLVTTTNGTGYMHESIDVNDVSVFSRPWFAWANSLFAYFVLKHKEIIRKGQYKSIQ